MSENIMSKKDKIFLGFTIISIILYIVAIFLSRKNGLFVCEGTGFDSYYNFTLRGFFVISYPLIYFFIAAIFTYNVPNVQGIMKAFIIISWLVGISIFLGSTLKLDLDVNGAYKWFIGSIIVTGIGCIL